MAERAQLRVLPRALHQPKEQARHVRFEPENAHVLSNLSSLISYATSQDFY
jgi:hypothetical protein